MERVRGLDLLRGWAVGLMVVDHLCAVWWPASPLRLLTRASMPLFFLLAGHLARCNWGRLAVTLAWGLALPLWVSWLDAPNVLVLYAVGVPLVVWAQRLPDRGLFGVAASLTWAANGWVHPAGCYDPASVLALMLLGRQLPLRELVSAWRGPQLLEWVGRHALGWYVVHLLVLGCFGKGGGNAG